MEYPIYHNTRHATACPLSGQAVYANNIYRRREVDLFATILLVQSLPFLAAVALVWAERFGDDKQMVTQTTKQV